MVKRGFALIDVVIAVVILGVGLAVVIGLSGRSIASAQQGETLAIAAALADEQLNLVLARGPDDYARRFATEGNCDEPFEAYRFRVEFSGGRNAGEPYDVRVTIRWGNASAGSEGDENDPRSLEVRTLMAARDVGIDAEIDPDRRPLSPIQRGGVR